MHMNNVQIRSSMEASKTARSAVARYVRGSHDREHGVTGCYEEDVTAEKVRARTAAPKQHYSIDIGEALLKQC